MMNFLLASLEMLVMFAMRGYSVNEMVIVLGRSLLMRMFSISGYEDWTFSMIFSLLTKRRFLPLYIDKSSTILPLSCGVLICSVEILMVLTLKYCEKSVV